MAEVEERAPQVEVASGALRVSGKLLPQ